MTDIHALIRAFLQDQTIISLIEPPAPPHDGHTKAGLVPFTRGQKLRFFVMKPHGKKEGLGPPPFQLCKGTRQYTDMEGKWCDMRNIAPTLSSQDMESLAETAIREGEEELGLVTKNIAQLYNLGPYHFASATTGSRKDMWLFAAEIMQPEAFLPDSAVAAYTQARQWMTAEEFTVVGRKDHHYILRDVETKLMRHLGG